MLCEFLLTLFSVGFSQTDTFRDSDCLTTTCPLPPPCTEGEEPLRKGCCYTCRKFDCTLEKCVEPPVCAEGTDPVREGCCVSCVPQKEHDCDALREECIQSYDDLPVCASQTANQSIYNASTCCVNCRRETNMTVTDCTKADYYICVESIPYCVGTEEPIRLPGQCCASCKRAAIDGTLLDVATCAEIPDCREGESPYYSRDSSGALDVCPSCKLVKPNCDSKCADGEVCVRSDVGPQCRAKEPIRIILKAVEADSRPQLKNSTNEGVREILVEVITRFCDQSINAKECDVHKELLVSGLRANIVEAEEPGLVVDVEVAGEARELFKRSIQESADAGLVVGFPVKECTADSKEKCDAEEKPIRLEDGCPSCYLEPFLIDCTLVRCASPRDCAEGELPMREGCCATCKPATECTDDARIACKESYDTLPECGPRIEGEATFDPTTCCQTCKLETADKSVTECTKEDFFACQRLSPECVGAEEPLRVPGRCCASCKRPSRDVPLLEVAKCATLPNCTANEKPFYIQGDAGLYACPSCRIVTTCATECAAEEVCVRSGEGPVCIGRKKIDYIVKAVKTAMRGTVKNATNEEIREMFVEIVERFCDISTNADLCDAFKQKLISGLRCKIVKAEDSATRVEVDVPTGQGRRLQTGNTEKTAEDLLRDAIDSYEDEGVLIGVPEMGCSAENLLATRRCGPEEKPTRLADGCPSCYREPYSTNCTEAIQCSLAWCDEGVLPQRDGCCATCKPAEITCTEELKTACRNDYTTLPECGPIIEGESIFNPETCCVTCRKTSIDKPVSECTREDFLACIESTSECVGTEEPFRLPGQCCASCKRPSLNVPLLDVAKCAAVPDCAAGEKPFYVRGDAGLFSCPSCNKPRLNCTCGNGNVCTRAGECRRSKVVKLFMKAKQDAQRAELKNATPKEVRMMLIEITKRFCDRTKNAERCASNLESLISGLTCSISRAGDSSSEIVAEVPEDVTPTRRRLLTGSTILEDAIADSSFYDIDITIDGTTGTTEIPGASMSTKVCASVLTIAMSLIAGWM